MTLDGHFGRGEEIANFVSHLVGASIALAGLVVLIIFATLKGTSIHVVSVSIFGACMLLLYLSSTLYHGLKPKRAKNIFFIFDQVSIYLMIAGSYTPIALFIIKGTLGWTMFGIQWGIAILGILFVTIKHEGLDKGIHPLKVVSFIIMGWLALVSWSSLFYELGYIGISLLLAGGLFYTVGVGFFVIEKMKYNHLIWHILVIFGTVCHYIMIFRYILLL